MFIQRMCLGGLGVGSLWTEKRAGRKRGERGEERSRFQQFSSPPTDVSRWPGERGPLTEGQRDTCEWQNLTLTNAQKHTYIHIHTHTHTHTHTQLCSVLFVLARPLAPNIDGMFDCPPLAPLRHDVTPTKCRLFKEKQLFMCSGPHNEKREGRQGQRHGKEEEIKRERKRDEKKLERDRRTGLDMLDINWRRVWW